jgi:hypothetical protein
VNVSCFTPKTPEVTTLCGHTNTGLGSSQGPCQTATLLPNAVDNEANADPVLEIMRVRTNYEPLVAEDPLKNQADQHASVLLPEASTGLQVHKFKPIHGHPQSQQFPSIRAIAQKSLEAKARVRPNQDRRGLPEASQLRACFAYEGDELAKAQRQHVLSGDRILQPDNDSRRPQFRGFTQQTAKSLRIQVVRVVGKV